MHMLKFGKSLIYFSIVNFAVVLKCVFKIKFPKMEIEVPSKYNNPKGKNGEFKITNVKFNKFLLHY